jgi:uncharacterized membrane protein
MNDVFLLRALHVLGVVLWVGGVAFVTLILLPAVKQLKSPHERVAFFTQIEGRFAWHARWMTLLVGVTGFYMVFIWDLWPRFHLMSYWWMHAMVFVWVLFTLMLFILEPLFLHEWFLRHAQINPEKTFNLIYKMHWILLIISIVTIFGAVLGGHGWLI